MYCFVLHIGINVYFTNNKETHRSCACFQRANTISGRMFDRVCMLKASTGLVCLFAICTTFIYYIGMCIVITSSEMVVKESSYFELDCHIRQHFGTELRTPTRQINARRKTQILQKTTQLHKIFLFGLRQYYHSYKKKRNI